MTSQVVQGVIPLWLVQAVVQASGWEREVGVGWSSWWRHKSVIYCDVMRGVVMSLGVPRPFIGMTSGRVTSPGARIESRSPDFLVHRLVRTRSILIYSRMREYRKSERVLTSLKTGPQLFMRAPGGGTWRHPIEEEGYPPDDFISQTPPLLPFSHSFTCSYTHHQRGFPLHYQWSHRNVNVTSSFLLLLLAPILDK